MDWAVVGMFVDDGLSGTLPMAKRPGLTEAVAAVKARSGTAFMVYSVSRLARTQKELWDLVDDRGEWALPLVSASEPFDVSTAAGKAFLGMLATFATLESDLARERTTAALEAARERGTKLGAPSMVERVVDGVRTVDTEKADVVRLIQGLYASGEWSLESLAAELNSRGVPTAKGGRWHKRTVRVAVGIKLDEAGK
jgi:site-specific DNA recombinase